MFGAEEFGVFLLKEISIYQFNL